MEDQIAGYLEKHVADEENTRAKAVNRVRKLQVGGHLQLGKADIDPVNIRKQPCHHEQWQDAPGDAAEHYIVGGGDGLTH